MNEGGSFPRKCLETGVRLNGHSHKAGRNTPEVTQAEGEQEVKAFWSQLHEWELIKPFWGFFCSFFLVAKKISHKQ